MIWHLTALEVVDHWSHYMYSSSSRSPRGLGLWSESISGNSAMSLKTPTKALKFGLQLRRLSQEAGPEGDTKPERSSSDTFRVVNDPRPPELSARNLSESLRLLSLRKTMPPGVLLSSCLLFSYGASYSYSEQVKESFSLGLSLLVFSSWSSSVLVSKRSLNLFFFLTPVESMLTPSRVLTRLEFLPRLFTRSISSVVSPAGFFFFLRRARLEEFRSLPELSLRCESGVIR